MVYCIFTLFLILAEISLKRANGGDSMEGDNFRRRDTGTLTKIANQVNSRYGWLRIRPLWMDIEKSCFSRTCIAPYAVQLISIEASINHTAMFYMDIDDPAPPVDMYFPSPPCKQSKIIDAHVEHAWTTTNFSVGLFGVDPTYRFPRHCHTMIENSINFTFEIRKKKDSILAPSPAILSFGADCLNLTFQITVTPAVAERDSNEKDESDNESEDSANLFKSVVTSAETMTFSVRTPVPMWIVAILAGINAALLFTVITLIWHVALSAKKKRVKRIRRQRSSAASSNTITTNSYVPACTTPMCRRTTPPVPPVPLPPTRPPPSRTVTDDADQQEPKYDVPWTEPRSNGVDTDGHFKISYNTLQHKIDHPQISYYFTADDQPVITGTSLEINCNDRPKPLRRTTTPNKASLLC